MFFGDIGGYAGVMFDVRTPWNGNNPYAYQGEATTWTLSTPAGQFDIYPSPFAGVEVRL